MNIFIKPLLIIIFFQSFCLSASAFNANDHRIAALVNDQIITSYDVVQRMKLNAILSGIDITAENNNRLLNSVVDELINEKLKNQKINEYNISVSEEEYQEQESLFYQNNPINKEDLIKIFKLNEIKYTEFKKYIINGISWQKLISGMYYRLTSTSEIEIEEIITKNPNISEEAARNMIVQRQLDLKSNKVIRDLFNEATIEYK
jgi:peptidyl-prolyl cis-trans isomerase SurA